MRKYIHLTSLLILGVFLLSSCGSHRTSYFQDLNSEIQSIMVDLDSSIIAHETMIKPKDELIIVISSVDPDAALPFNLYYKEGRFSASSQSANTSDERKMVSYVVDNKGFVNLPTLGKIKLAGLTVDQATLYLEEILSKYIISPIVNLQITNFKVSILGAINSPGTFYFNNRQVSILDVIASAKDLLPQARRDNILLIRTNEGKKEYVRFDLTKSDVIASPYFYLQQNDILYVEPNKAIQQDASMNQRKQYNLTIITSVISAVISATSLIIAVSKK